MNRQINKTLNDIKNNIMRNNVIYQIFLINKLTFFK